MPSDDDLNFRYENPRMPERPPATGPVGNWPIEDRFISVMKRTASKLPGEVGEEFSQLLTPMVLAGLIPVLVLWAAAHACPITWLVDALTALIIGLGMAMSIYEIWNACGEFIAFLQGTATAQTEADLDSAATHLAQFIASVGVAIFFLIVARNGKPLANRAATAMGGVLAANATRAGMLGHHAEAFANAAKSMQRFILVRFTNQGSTKWIQRGYPAKPMCIKAKTHSETGIVTIGKDPAKAPQETMEALTNGYYVVDADLVARGTGGKILALPKQTEWPLQRGQVIDPLSQKPLVGDYDLMGVVDPLNPGQNISLSTSGGISVADRTNPMVKRVADFVNSLIGEKRVMHGAHDQYGGLDDAGEGIIVFEPNGESKILSTLGEIRDYYMTSLGGRQPATGSYPKISVDEAMKLADRDNVIFVDFKSKTRFEPN
ncbi:MAG: hypothetical protein KDB01_08645 [Planctomycetaceae bacterium]|nr:hypothetical protein [Planctomycetaceae bacterium]